MNTVPLAPLVQPVLFATLDMLLEVIQNVLEAADQASLDLPVAQLAKNAAVLLLIVKAAILILMMQLQCFAASANLAISAAMVLVFNAHFH
jgi:hypothetical protein